MATIAEIVIEILGLDRPVVPDGIFHAASEGPAGPRARATANAQRGDRRRADQRVGERIDETGLGDREGAIIPVAADFAIGKAACRVDEDAVEGITRPQAHGADVVAAVVALRAGEEDGAGHQGYPEP